MGRHESLEARVARLLATPGALPRGLLAAVDAGAPRGAGRRGRAHEGGAPGDAGGGDGEAEDGELVEDGEIGLGGTANAATDGADDVHLSDLSDSEGESDGDGDEGGAAVEGTRPAAWRLRGGDWQICEGSGEQVGARKYRLYPEAPAANGADALPPAGRRVRDPRTTRAAQRAYERLSGVAMLELPPWAAEVTEMLDSTRTPERDDAVAVLGDAVGAAEPAAQDAAADAVANGAGRKRARDEGELDEDGWGLGRHGGVPSQADAEVEDGEADVPPDARMAGAAVADDAAPLPPPPRMPVEQGKWYYYDGCWRPHGSYTFAQLRELAASGERRYKGLSQHSMVCREADNLWMPAVALPGWEPDVAPAPEPETAAGEGADSDLDLDDWMDAELEDGKDGGAAAAAPPLPRAPEETEALLRAELVKSALAGVLRRRLLDQVVHEQCKKFDDALRNSNGADDVDPPSRSVPAPVPTPALPADALMDDIDSDAEDGAVKESVWFARRREREEAEQRRRREAKEEKERALREKKEAELRAAAEEAAAKERQLREHAAKKREHEHALAQKHLRENPGVLPATLLDRIVAFLREDGDKDALQSFASTCKAYRDAAFGDKHGGGKGAGVGVGGSQQPRLAALLAGGGNAAVAFALLKQQIQQLFSRLRKECDPFRIFGEPVDTAKFPDYLDVIERPMDFSTMVTKLEQGEYGEDVNACLAGIRADVRLIGRNCIKYNSDESSKDIAATGQRLVDEGGAFIDEFEADIASQLFGGTAARQAKANVESARVRDTEARAARRAPRKRRLAANKDGGPVGGTRVDMATRTEIPASIPYKELEEYEVVCEVEDNERKRQAALPPAGDEPAPLSLAALNKNDLPEVAEADASVPKRLGVDVRKEEVFGIDGFTHYSLVRALMSCKPGQADYKSAYAYDWYSDIIEGKILPRAQDAGRAAREAGEASVALPLAPAVQLAADEASARGDADTATLLADLKARIESPKEDESFYMHSKGMGITCAKEGGLRKGEFIKQYLGEMYPPWRWFERQDAIRSTQRFLSAEKESPEFYNITLERARGDMLGTDIIYVEAMYRTAFVSRLSHSCEPNCETRAKVVNGVYTIQTVTTRPIAEGEELTFNYNCVTDSKAEAEKATCLCGSRWCQGSYLQWKGARTFRQVLDSSHGMTHRQAQLMQACEENAQAISEGAVDAARTVETSEDVAALAGPEGVQTLARAGIGAAMLRAMPGWMVRFVVKMVEICDFEKAELPKALMRKGPESDGYVYTLEDATHDADSNWYARMNAVNIAVDKVRKVLAEWRKTNGDSTVPPPIYRCDGADVAERLWCGEDSVARRLLSAVRPHIDDGTHRELSLGVESRDAGVAAGASGVDGGPALRTALLWLRDEVAGLQDEDGVPSNARHDLAADLLHLHAHCRTHLRTAEYASFTSEPVEVLAADLPPVAQERLRAMPDAEREEMLAGGPASNTDGHAVAQRVPGATYAAGFLPALLFLWSTSDMAVRDLVGSLGYQQRGCTQLPDVRSCYSPSPAEPLPKRLGKSAKQQTAMCEHLLHTPQRSWPPNWGWTFDDARSAMLASPMLDVAIGACSKEEYEGEVLGWLRARAQRSETP